MSYQLRLFASFERHLKSIIKKYPLSESAIRAELTALVNNPEQGDVYPGFSPYQIRKFRIGLKAYRIGSSGGLRLIFIHHQPKALVVPVVIYKKGIPTAEHEIRRLVLDSLHDILRDLA